MHRYWALHRVTDGQRVYDLARRVVPEVLPITGELTDTARRLLTDHPLLSARDALHAAVVLAYDLAGICSYDSDYDAVPNVPRIRPADLAASAPPATPD